MLPRAVGPAPAGWSETPSGDAREKSQNDSNVRRMALRRTERDNPVDIRKHQQQFWVNGAAPR